MLWLPPAEQARAPVSQNLKPDEQHRDEQHADEGRENHAAENSGADRLASAGARAACDDQWNNPDNEGERRHHYWAVSGARALIEKAGGKVELTEKPVVEKKKKEKKAKKTEAAEGEPQEAAKPAKNQG